MVVWKKEALITDFIHTAKKIFNYLLHPFQIHIASISDELRKFFANNPDNMIKFLECPSCCKWSLHKIVDKETKKFWPNLCYSCKSLWDFDKKSECDDIISR